MTIIIVEVIIIVTVFTVPSLGLLSFTTINPNTIAITFAKKWTKRIFRRCNLYKINNVIFLTFSDDKKRASDESEKDDDDYRLDKGREIDDHCEQVAAASFSSADNCFRRDAFHLPATSGQMSFFCSTCQGHPTEFRCGDSSLYC